MNLVTGEIFCRTPRRKNSQNLTRTLDAHLKTLGEFRRIHYIMDNDPTHTSKHTMRWLESQEGRVKFHFTPKYSSWLNQAEIGLHRFRGRAGRDVTEVLLDPFFSLLHVDVACHYQRGIVRSVPLAVELLYICK